MEDSAFTIGSACTSLSSAPSTPDTNWAYYDNTKGVSFIYNGSSWDTLALSGMYAKTVSGAVASWDSLILQHNLNRSDIAFTAQFIKNGIIYDFSDYSTIFSDTVNRVDYNSDSKTSAYGSYLNKEKYGYIEFQNNQIF